MSLYDIVVDKIDGQPMALSAFSGKVLLIVNTASACGFTPQYTGLQELYEKYNRSGFEVLGFPCNQFGGQEPGTNQDIEQFCNVNYHVTFPMFSKIDVNGPGTHPLYEYLKDASATVDGNDENHSGSEQNDIKWNFTKFLINQQGQVVRRFESKVKPSETADDIDKLFG